MNIKRLDRTKIITSSFKSYLNSFPSILTYEPVLESTRLFLNKLIFTLSLHRKKRKRFSNSHHLGNRNFLPSDAGLKRKKEKEGMNRRGMNFERGSRAYRDHNRDTGEWLKPGRLVSLASSDLATFQRLKRRLPPFLPPSVYVCSHEMVHRWWPSFTDTVNRPQSLTFETISPLVRGARVSRC